jgi:DNA primase
MAIPQQTLDEIQEKTDIVSLVTSYIPLKKSGRNFRTTCPFHSEKTPSFFVSPARQIFHCFGCGAGGGAIQFVMQYEKVGFVEAVEMLGKRVGIVIPRQKSPQDSLKSKAYIANKESCLYFHKNLFSPVAGSALEYLKKRGITDETLKQFKIGYALSGFRDLLSHMRSKGASLSILDKAGLVSSTQDGSFIDLFRNRIVFAIFDVKSRVIGFGARRLVEDKNVPKYINTPESVLYHKGSTLYGINLAKESILKNDSCLVVEGYLDMIMPFQYGIQNIVASLGTALTVDQIRMMKRYTKNVVLIFDSDAAGKSSSLRAIDLLVEHDLNIKAVSLPSGFDPDSFVRKEGKEGFLKLIEGAEDFFFYKLKVLSEQFDVNNINEKSKLLLEMLSTLAKFNNQIIRYEYIKRLAVKLNTREESLMAELKKIETKSRSFRPSQTQPQPAVPSDKAQEYLVRCILCDKKLLKLVKEVVGPQDFSSPVLRKIVEEAFAWWDKHDDFDANKMLSHLNGEVANKISQLFLEDFSLDEEVFKESILKLKRNTLRRRKDILKDEIKKAEESNNLDGLVDLIAEYEKVIKQEKM